MSISAFISSHCSQVREVIQSIISPANASRRNKAISEVAELRDVHKQKADFLKENQADLRNLLGTRSYQEATEALQMINEEPALVIQAMRCSGCDLDLETIKMDLEYTIERIGDLLSSLGNHFEVYVSEKEQAVQEQLSIIADIEKTDPNVVDRELQNMGKIQAPLDFEERRSIQADLRAELEKYLQGSTTLS